MGGLVDEGGEAPKLCRWRTPTRTQRIITSDDGHGCGNERGLTERNREVDAPVGGRDLVCE